MDIGLVRPGRNVFSIRIAVRFISLLLMFQAPRVMLLGGMCVYTLYMYIYIYI